MDYEHLRSHFEKLYNYTSELKTAGFQDDDLFDNLGEISFSGKQIAEDLPTFMENLPIFGAFLEGFPIFSPIIKPINEFQKARKLKAMEAKINSVKANVIQLEETSRKHSKKLHAIRNNLELINLNISELHHRLIKVEYFVLILMLFIVATIIATMFNAYSLSKIDRKIKIYIASNKVFRIPPIDRELYVGMEGNDVLKIENFLNTLGYNPGRVDGKFNKDTERAVMQLQDDLSVEIDGIIGRNTMVEIRRYIGGKEGRTAILEPFEVNIDNSIPSVQTIPSVQRELLIGMEGSDVCEIENFLKNFGYNPGEIDGKFDKDTEHAVMQLQDYLSVDRDGIIGVVTMQQLSKNTQKNQITRYVYQQCD